MRPTDHPSSMFPSILMVLIMAGAVPVIHAAPPAAAGSQQTPITFARVGDSTITQEEYNAAFAAATRGKFYHGKPPEAEIAVLQREVGDQMVARIVLLQETKRRGLRPDAAAIQKQVLVYEQRYANSEAWKKNREQTLPPLVARLEQDNLLSQLEKTVREKVKPTQAQVQAYFAAHQDKFTEPEQIRVSVILLKVDPSASSATWKAAEEQAKSLADRARSGEDFSALARQFSAEASGPQGGDMGYLHNGMLPDGSQAAISKLKINEISGPQRLLEGVAVFQLINRKLAKLHKFDTVKVRANELTQRDQANIQWDKFIKELRGKTIVQIDQSRFLPLAK